MSVRGLFAAGGLHGRRSLALSSLHHHPPGPPRLLHAHTHAASPPPAPVQPLAPAFNRREKKNLRRAFPRPDKAPTLLVPPVPASFVNRVTMADGSSFYLTTRSPRPTITLARDVTNHGLWNPSLARDVADQDQSGRMGRFARRYGAANAPSDPSSPPSSTTTTTESAPSDHQQRPPLTSSTQNHNQNLLDQHGFGIDDLQWISGESTQSFYGIGNAKNIKGLKKPAPASKK